MTLLQGRGGGEPRIIAKGCLSQSQAFILSDTFFRYFKYTLQSRIHEFTWFRLLPHGPQIRSVRGSKHCLHHEFVLNLLAGVIGEGLQHGGDSHCAARLDDAAAGAHAVAVRAGALHLEAHFPLRRVAQFKTPGDYSGEGAFELEDLGRVDDQDLPEFLGGAGGGRHGDGSRRRFATPGLRVTTAAATQVPILGIPGPWILLGYVGKV